MSKYIKYEPCCCGANRREHLHRSNRFTLRCKECGLHISGTSEYDVKKQWNRIMRKIKYGEGDPWCPESEDNK